MALNLDREIFKKAFPDPALVIMYGPWQSAEDEQEALTEAKATADSHNHYINFITANATCQRRVSDVLTIKPILTAKPLSLDDWEIARIVSSVGKIGEQYPSDILSVVAHTIRRTLPADKTLYDFTPKDLSALSVIFYLDAPQYSYTPLQNLPRSR